MLIKLSALRFPPVVLAKGRIDLVLGSLTAARSEMVEVKEVVSPMVQIVRSPMVVEI